MTGNKFEGKCLEIEGLEMLPHLYGTANKHINFFNIDFLGPPPKTPHWGPQNKRLCASFPGEGRKKGDPHKLFRGEFWGQKGGPKRAISATKSLVYCFFLALNLREIRRKTLDPIQPLGLGLEGSKAGKPWNAYLPLVKHVGACGSGSILQLHVWSGISHSFLVSTLCSKSPKKGFADPKPDFGVNMLLCLKLAFLGRKIGQTKRPSSLQKWV